MAPAKFPGEGPRTILSRLTGPRSRVNLSSPVANSIGSQLGSLTLSSRFSVLSSPASRPVSVSTDIARCVSESATTNGNRPSLDSLNCPVRYNGVYVATFKPAQRAFHASAICQRDHHFDTLKFVKRLRAEGFSEEQAAAMMRILNDVIQESIQNLTRTMVLKEG